MGSNTSGSSRRVNACRTLDRHPLERATTVEPIQAPTPTSTNDEDSGHIERDMFDGARRATAQLLVAEPDMTVVSTWALGFLRGADQRELRHAALDGILAALEDHEAQL